MRLALTLAFLAVATPAWCANTLQTGCDDQGCRPVICANAKHCGVERGEARWRGMHAPGVILRDQRYGAEPFDTGFDTRSAANLTTGRGPGIDHRYNPIRQRGYDRQGLDRGGLWPGY